MFVVAKSKTTAAEGVHILPTSAYLADPLNTYALLGCPRPGVWFVDEPWGVAVDARGSGFFSPEGPEGDFDGRGEGEAEVRVVDGRGGARWARNGCWPNAVLRPVICRRERGRPPLKVRRKHTQAQGEGEGGDGAGGGAEVEEEKETPPLTFALFATRDLRAQEEVVLGWEWDDGCVVHVLPALVAAGEGAFGGGEGEGEGEGGGERGREFG